MYIDISIFINIIYIQSLLNFYKLMKLLLLSLLTKKKKKLILVLRRRKKANYLMKMLNKKIYEKNNLIVFLPF